MVKKFFLLSFACLICSISLAQQQVSLPAYKVNTYIGNVQDTCI